MLIESLSPGNCNHDLKRKFELYEQSGVPEYIIADPLTKEVLHYFLKEGAYEQLPAANGRIEPKVLQSGFFF